MNATQNENALNDNVGMCSPALQAPFWKEDEHPITPGKGDLIGPGRAVRGVTILVPAYRDMRVGDTLFVLLRLSGGWRGWHSEITPLDRNATRRVVVGPDDIGKALSVTFAYLDFMYAESPRMMTADFTYALHRIGLPGAAESEQLTLRVDGRGDFVSYIAEGVENDPLE